MKFQDIEALMQAVDCQSYPTRWNDIFDTVMADFDKNGCFLTDPSYYDMLYERYGVLNRHLALFKEAAAEVGKREPLARLLALLVACLKDREHVDADLKAFVPPASPEGAHDLAVDMLTGLALFAMIPYTAEKIAPRHLPDYISHYILQSSENCVDYFKNRFGAPGCNLIGWYQLAIEGNIFRVKRLEIQIFDHFKGGTVFENAAGRRVALCHGKTLHQRGFPLGSYGFEDEKDSFTAEITETESAYIGHPYAPNGWIETHTVTLPKSEWHPILTTGDPVVSLHIPSDGRLDSEAVEETLLEAKKVLAQYYPDFHYKAFVCHSWLLDPQLIGLLGEEANISKFCRRFTPMATKSAGKAALNFIFFDPYGKKKPEDYPGDTRLQRVFKAHYASDQVIYETYGYFFP